MDPSGAAAASGLMKAGDQLCEIQAVPPTDDSTTTTAPENMLGAPFDFVMSTFGSLDRTVKDVDLVFFRGTKDELKAACSPDGSGAAKNLRGLPRKLVISRVFLFIYDRGYIDRNANLISIRWTQTNNNCWKRSESIYLAIKKGAVVTLGRKKQQQLFVSKFHKTRPVSKCTRTL
jgi:hypothetical protein